MRMRKLRFKNLILHCTLFVVLCTLIGCEAFVRKFTRKPKNQDLPREEMVLAPEEYTGPQMSKEELYRHYFLFWKSWQDELIVSLHPGANHKKQMDCLEEALRNLARVKDLLGAQKNQQALAYLEQLGNLKDSVNRDLYGNDITNNRTKAEQLKRNILRDLSYNKVKDNLI